MLDIARSLLKETPLRRIGLVLFVGHLLFAWGYADASNPHSWNAENDLRLAFFFLALAYVFALILALEWLHQK